MIMERSIFLYFAFKTKEVVTKGPSISYKPGSKIGNTARGQRVH